MMRLIDSYPEIMGIFGREDVNGKLNELLREALEAIEDAPGDKAKASVTLDIAFARDGDRVTIVPAVKSKLPPQAGFRGTTCWLVEGKISLQHPSQIDMFSGPREVAPRTRDAG
ncbi:hypothetical protein [Methylosinus sp. Sm6]|uniref:hypothetical protein n=1 Tax=Methylosinus sp. Sm6 TaxID=2866948 RepID=UPI001C992654|nr:hypothetical protein [Methylosinus sp. Sm6]MBY6239847.1 hypothetical protein [Methylosinus sp. Sm6]